MTLPQYVDQMSMNRERFVRALRLGVVRRSAIGREAAAEERHDCEDREDDDRDLELTGGRPVVPALYSELPSASGLTWSPDSA